ncbi:STPG1 [Branchiostoma lanceolatum]|uniref:STPG1 protein n=1 Tax=Branchiostoma lanceolatum TaxID=7740 RepID=A0A8K0EJJ5_BRALA|nr:STPG1 [Branchiostoma lanceolatum]
MADSVKSFDQGDVRRIHSQRSSGRLHKGHGIAAATSSIPSKFQTIVSDNSDKRGFGAKARRFNHDEHMNDLPGPGSYVRHGTLENTSTSLSKKGTGGFASKSKRKQSHTVPAGPGPVYALPSLLRTQGDFNKAGCTGSFHRPIAVSTEKPDYKPAPNTYTVVETNVAKNYGQPVQASFKSTTRRPPPQGIQIVKSKVPAPWHYDINDDQVKESAKVPFSSFKSTSDRMRKVNLNENPGPGEYRPFEEADKRSGQKFPMKHYLCISAPAMPLPHPIPDPGPGAYNLVNYKGPQKHYMSSSMFVSNTSRWTFKGKERDQPGPATYHPEGTGKQSFIYNTYGRWVPT